MSLHHGMRMMASRNHGVADVAGVIVVRVVAGVVVSGVSVAVSGVSVVVSGASEAAFAEIEAPSAVATEVASVVATGMDGLMVTGGATKIVDVAGDVDVDVERGEAIMRGTEPLLLESGFCEQKVLKVLAKKFPTLWLQLHALPSYISLMYVHPAFT